MTMRENDKNMNLYDENGYGISGFGLKMIAVITMLIDHIAATIILRMMCYSDSSMFTDNIDTWQNIYSILRGIGRMAFPIYCFLIVEGFNYTKNKYKYLLRLAIFALISEIPYDMAFNNCVLEITSNNVFFTLAMGLCAIIGIDYIKDKITFGDETENIFCRFVKMLLKCIAMMTIVLGTMVLNEYVLSADYGASGVATIVIMYFLYTNKMVGFLCGVIFLGLTTASIEFVALLMVFLINMYNGERGKQLKYFFYGFYPVHLMILSGICYLLNLNIR